MIEHRFVSEFSIIMIYAKRLGILDHLKNRMPAVPRSFISGANLLMILVFCLITGRQPLYAMSRFVSKLDGRILGLDTDLTRYGIVGDDRFARRLDNLHDVDRASLMTEAAMSLCEKGNINIDRIHNDSTSISSSGKMCRDASDGLSFKNGYSKDRRPDWKQIIFTLSMAADANIPIHYKIYSGNITDDKTHIDSWKTLCKITNKIDFLYVADSKLATDEQLNYIAGEGGRAITVMPRTWGEYSDFKEELKKGDIEKKLIFSKRTRGKTCLYYAFDIVKKTRQGFSIHWIYSSLKAGEDSDFRKKQIEKTAAKLKKLQQRLKRQKPVKAGEAKKKGQRKLFDKAEIAAAVKTILDAGRVKALFSWNTAAYIRDDIAGTSKTVYFRLRFSLNKKAIEETSKTDGIFPLISTDTGLKAEEVIKAYKHQPFIEVKFDHVKNLHEVSSPLFKRTDRFEALLFVEWIALAIEAMIERDLKKAAEINGLPLHPEGRMTKNPTFKQLSRLFENVVRYIIKSDNKDKAIIYKRGELSSDLKMVLTALSISEDEFWNTC